MKEYFSLFGTYNLRARISPGIILATPVIVNLYLLIPALRNLGAIVLIMIVCFSLCNLIITCNRTARSKAKQKCFPNGMPAQTMLLPSCNRLNFISKKRYYEIFKEKLPDFSIHDSDNEMKPYIESAIAWLISNTRNAEGYPLIAEENANFGFAYNMYGLKVAGIITSLSCLVIDIVGIVIKLLNGLNNLTYLNLSVALGVSLFFFLIWLCLVKTKYVVSCGEKYAEALISACDKLKTL